jgi:hypothetical protein
MSLKKVGRWRLGRVCLCQAASGHDRWVRSRVSGCRPRSHVREGHTPPVWRDTATGRCRSSAMGRCNIPGRRPRNTCSNGPPRSQALPPATARQGRRSKQGTICAA